MNQYDISLTIKQMVRMADGQFADGTRQSFYFPPGHPRAGVFKGMAIILEERGFEGCQGCKGRRAECEGFKCLPGAIDCCCRRILYNQLDFVDVESLLETEVPGERVPGFVPIVNSLPPCEKLILNGMFWKPWNVH